MLITTDTDDKALPSNQDTELVSTEYATFGTRGVSFNPLRAKFYRGNINIYLHFVSFLHIVAAQVVEILLQIKQEPTYSTELISWLLMSWRRNEPGHQQPWYWTS